MAETLEIISQEVLAAPYAMAPGMILPAPSIGGRALPQAVEDVERDFGLSVWDKLANEPCLYASDWLLRALALEPGLRVVGAIAKPPRDTEPTSDEALRYAQSEEIAAFIRRDLAAMAQPTVDEVLWQAMAGYGRGHRFAELTEEVRTDVDGVARVFTKSLRPKGRASYRLVVDRFGELLGAQPSQGRYGWWEGENFDEEVEILTPERFVLWSFNGEDGDPRGRGAYRATYDSWYRKLQAKPEHLKMLVQFGGGRISADGPALEAGKTNEMTWTNRAGQLVKGRYETYVVEVLRGFAAGGVCALPPGWKLTMHQPPQTGGVFDQAFALLDREMVLAYLKVTRATTEAQHGSKADSSDANSLLDSVVGYLRKILCSVLKLGYARRRVAMNFGEQAAREMTPDFTLEKPRDQDLLATAQAGQILMTLARTPEQVNHVETLVGMPESDGIIEQAATEEKPAPKFEDARVAGVSASYSKAAKALWKRAQKLVGQFQGGDIDRDAFLDGFLGAIEDLHHRAAKEGIKAAGKRSAKLSEDDEARLAEILQEQGDFAEGLADRIEADPESAAHLTHARMYFQRARGTSGEFFELASPAGEKFTWRLGGGDHCADCPRYAALSPYEKGELGWWPGSCDSECLTECKCDLVRDSDGAIAPGRVDFD